METLTLGEKLRFYRIRNRVSQAKLEQTAKLSLGSISRMENNQITPTTHTLLKIGTALSLSSKEIAYLFDINLYTEEKDWQGKILEEMVDEK